jgi:DNA-binding transcriptional ArsR family regulator
VNSHEPLPDPLVELIAQRFRVLGEPVRIKLLDSLRVGPAGVSELARQLGLSQQNASKHLGVLAAAGLVERTRTGNSALYTISDPSVFALCELVCDALRDRVVAMQAIIPPAPAQPVPPLPG